MITDEDVRRRLHELAESAGPWPDPSPAVVARAGRSPVRRRTDVRRSVFNRRSALALAGAGLLAAGCVTAALMVDDDSQPSGTLTAGGPAAPAPATPAHRSAANLPPRSAWRGSPASVPPPCPADVTTPSMPHGTYCGPPPTAGNGLGPDGVCTGAETAPPCGPGAIVGKYYAYTLPGYDPAPGCNGLIYFDGRRWLSELPPPDTEPPAAAQYVWMALQADGRVGLIGPGAVGFDPATPATQAAC